MNANNIGNGSTIEEIATHSNTGFFCAACKSGFAPSYQNFNNEVITGQTIVVYNCAKIANCAESGNAFNRCDKCDSNYSFEFDDTLNSEKIMRVKCVATTDPNCYSALADGTCKICDDGFSFNVEGECEKLGLLNCDTETNSSIQKDFYYSTVEYNMIHLSNQQTGCNKCANPNDALVMKYDVVGKQERPFYCTYSPFVKNSNINSGSSWFEPNCVEYKNIIENSQYVCAKCNSESVIDTNGNCLSSNSDLTHCLIAESFARCQTCLNGYVLVKDKCT